MRDDTQAGGAAESVSDLFLSKPSIDLVGNTRLFSLTEMLSKISVSRDKELSVVHFKTGRCRGTLYPYDVAAE